MVTSVRLDPKSEAIVRRLARRTGRTKSDIIREAVHRLAAETKEAGPTVYDRMAHLIGIANLGPGDRAARSEEILRAAFVAKHRARR